MEETAEALSVEVRRLSSAIEVLAEFVVTLSFQNAMTFEAQTGALTALVPGFMAEANKRACTEATKHLAFTLLAPTVGSIQARSLDAAAAKERLASFLQGLSVAPIWATPQGSD